MHSILLAALVCALPDKGIYPEFDAQIRLTLPERTEPQESRLQLDEHHGLLTLYQGDRALGVYRARTPARPPATKRDSTASVIDLRPGAACGSRGEAQGIELEPADLAELRPWIRPGTSVDIAPPTRLADRDGDGIVDPLDILLGARKLLLNRARYHESYERLSYPGGDIPRQRGVCTDTIVRALRNAGIDLQKEIHEDIRRAPRAYPTIRRADANIDHRRVRTQVRWFERHAAKLPLTDYRPGDIIFLDTLPGKPGPDHVGIVGDRRAASGLPAIINNWTYGSVDAEMDLLSFVPVTHHFRIVPTRR